MNLRSASLSVSVLLLDGDKNKAALSAAGEMREDLTKKHWLSLICTLQCVERPVSSHPWDIGSDILADIWRNRPVSGQGLPAWYILDKKPVTKPRVPAVDPFSDSPLSPFVCPLLLRPPFLTSLSLLYFNLCTSPVSPRGDDRLWQACVRERGWGGGGDWCWHGSGDQCGGAGGGVGIRVTHSPPPGEAAMLRVTPQVSRHPLQLQW